MGNSSNVYFTANGFTIRKEDNVFFGFIPHAGVIYFAKSTDYEKIRGYLCSDISNLPSEYQSLSVNSTLKFSKDKTHCLGDHKWETLPKAESPLIINWLITGECNHQCAYCYAQDIMQFGYNEQSATNTTNIIQNIKKYSPLAVVVTGGEPSLSPYFEQAIEELAKFTSVIVDTNATCLTSSHIETFAKHNVHVRVSLDSNKHEKNKKTRIPINKKESKKYFDEVLNSLSIMQEKNIFTTINSVATKYNYNEYKKLKTDLQKFGIKKLRIRFVENTNFISNYSELTGEERTINRFIRQAKGLVHHSSDIPVYITMNRPRNSIILVAPNGDFYTESQFIDQGKILIDSSNPQQPSLVSLHNQVDMHAHTSRYLLL